MSDAITSAPTETTPDVPHAPPGSVEEVAPPEDVMLPTLWKKSGWIASVMKNEDDDGWAVAMTRVGDSEPALVGPWTMGRDKRNPKPLNPKDFSTLVKTASEVLERAVAHARAKLHKSIYMTAADGTRLRVHLDIVADEDDPSATVTAFDDATNMQLWKKDVPPNFTLTTKSVTTLSSSASRDD